MALFAIPLAALIISSSTLFLTGKAMQAKASSDQLQRETDRIDELERELRDALRRVEACESDRLRLMERLFGRTWTEQQQGGGK